MNFHYRDPGNVGDYNCAPYEYFERGSNIGNFVPKDILPDDVSGRKVVVGGGGLIHPFFEQSWKRIISLKPDRLIAWGVGSNFHSKHDLVYPDYLGGVDLVGCRDWGSPFEWVACASCLSELFDKDWPVLHDVVALLHSRPGSNPSSVYANKFVKFGVPTMLNRGKMEDVIEFIGSGETVVTNTYHGMYWSTILGKRVVVVDPFSNRFFHHRYAPAFCDLGCWRDALNRTRSYPEALMECRDSNVFFAERVFND